MTPTRRQVLIAGGAVMPLLAASASAPGKSGGRRRRHKPGDTVLVVNGQQADRYTVIAVNDDELLALEPDEDT